MHPRRGDLLSCLALIALALAGFARLVARPGALIVDGGRPRIDHAVRDETRVVGNDLTELFLPHHLNVSARLARHGRFPLWDDSGFGGRPMVGNSQGGLFYPPVWLAWWSRSRASLGWLTVTHLICGSIGTYVLLRTVGASRVASVVGAGCFQLSPYVIAQTSEGHYPHVWAASWYPWAFWAFMRRRRGGIGNAVILPPILAMAFLTGHPQEWYYLVSVLSVWAMADALLAWRRDGHRAAVWAWAGWAGVLVWSLGLIAVELLPDLAVQRWVLQSGRMAMGPASRYHLHSPNVMQLLSPSALGGPADYFGRDNYWETVLSVGLLPLVLAAIARVRHPDRALTRGWLILVGAAVLFAAGRQFGLFAVLYAIAPGMDRFRVPARSLFLVALGASVLAGLGVDALARSTTAPGPGRWSRIGVAIVAVGLILGRIAASRVSPGASGLLETSRAMPWAFAASRVVSDRGFWLAVAGMTIAFAWLSRRPADRQLVAWSLGALALLELVVHAQGVVRVARAERFLGPDPISETLVRAEPLTPGPFRIRVRDTLYNDLRAFGHGFEKVNVNDWFQLQHAADLYETLYLIMRRPRPTDPAEPLGEAVARYRREVQQGVLDRMGVAFLVADHVDPDAPWPLLATGRWRGSSFAIHCNTTAMPRAYVVPRAVVAPEDPATVLSTFRHLNPRAAVLMARDPLGPSGVRQPFTPAVWASQDPDRIVVHVETRAPGLLVIGDTWMPGWTALDDGHPAPILRGNHAQRVIPLPHPGRHEVVLRYRPPGLDLGLAVTFVSGLASIVAWPLTRQFRSFRAHPPLETVTSGILGG